MAARTAFSRDHEPPGPCFAWGDPLCADVRQTEAQNRQNNFRVLHDTYTVLRNAAMPGPLTPRHKCTVCGDDDTPLRNLGARPCRRCLSAVCLSGSCTYVITLGAGFKIYILLSVHVREPE